MYSQTNDDGSWKVDSMSGVKSGGYTVTKIADQCAKNCSGPICTKAECNHLCIHMYTCDKACYDFNNGHICKHIHRVHSITQTSTTTEHTNNQPSSEELHLEDSCELDPLEYAESIIPPQQGTLNNYYMYTYLMYPGFPTCKGLCT